MNSTTLVLLSTNPSANQNRLTTPDPYRYFDCVSWAWLVQGPKDAESAEIARPKGVSKAAVQRCISKLSPYRIVEQLDQVVELIHAQGPVGPMQMASQLLV